MMYRTDRPSMCRMWLTYPPLLLLSLLWASSYLYADGDFEIEHHAEFTVKSKDGSYSLESNVKRWVYYLTERSTKQRVFPVPEPFYATVSDIHGRFPGGKLTKESISYIYHEQEDIFIADNKVWWLAFPQLKKGESVMYGYEMKYKGAEWFPIQYVPNNGKVKKFLLKIEHPSDVQVEFNMFFSREELPFRVENPNDELTMLIFEDVEEQEGLDYFPYNGFNAAIQVRLSQNGKAITPTTTEEFTAWYRTLFEQKPAVTPEHSAKVREAMVGATTPREKLKAIHDYVRTNIRYIAEEDDYGAIVPRSPDLVLQRGYGDCKDRAYLISALASEEGINVDMTLVATNPTPTFANSTYIHQYNHVICSWNDGTKRVYFDPTSKYTEFDNLPYSDVESTALVLDPKNPQMVRLPRPNQNAAIEVELRGNLSDPENVSARVTLRNVYFSAAMNAMDELRGLDLENMLSNMLNSHLYKISLDYFTRDSVGEDFVTFTANADLSNFLIASTAKKYLPAMPFRTIEADVLERKDDLWPITTNLQETIEMRMVLDLQGLSIEEKQVAFGDETHASFASSINLSEDGSALVNYRLWQASGLCEGDAKSQFLDFCQEYLKSKKQMFILSSTSE